MGSPSPGGDVVVFALDITNQACPLLFIPFLCPMGSPSRGGDIVVLVPSLPTPFYSVLVSGSIFMSLSSYSTVFHSINSSDNSALSRSVLSVLFKLLCIHTQSAQI